MNFMNRTERGELQVELKYCERCGGLWLRAQGGDGRGAYCSSCVRWLAEFPAAKVGAYSASKAALVSLVKTVALENKDAGITANVILPATIDTPGNRKAMPGADTSQWVEPASIASLIVWLASDAGKDVTGAAIPVYGRAA